MFKGIERTIIAESESEEEILESSDEEGFHERSDSIVDDADFVVDVSTDEEQRGFELLPGTIGCFTHWQVALFSREIGFRKSFDIFVEVLVRVSLDANYIDELHTGKSRWFSLII